MDIGKIKEVLEGALSCIDLMVDFLPGEDQMCSNTYANITAAANDAVDEIEKVKKALDEDAEYVPVIRMHPEEVKMLGGDPEDIDEIAEKVGETLMELGYWDVFKQVIQLRKER